MERAIELAIECTFSSNGNENGGLGLDLLFATAVSQSLGEGLGLNICDLAKFFNMNIIRNFEFWQLLP